jgi:serine/threonine-protein phosphatase CPPED1
MKTFRLIAALLILQLVTIPGTSQEKYSATPFFFIQVTDPQFGMYDSDKGFTKETELYEKAVVKINRLHPEFVVITGDLVNNKDDKSQIAEFKRITAEIDHSIPVWYSPGNHDIGQSPSQNDIDNFISNYGYDRFSFSHKNCLFIGLNSCIIKSGTPGLEQVQFDWLRKELSKAGNANHIILFSHYPFFMNVYDEPEEYSNIPLATRNRYLGLFKEYKVDAVFAGHLHRNLTASYGQMQMITTSAVGKPLDKTPSGFRIIKVYADKVESVYYPLDEVPQTVTFK